MLPRDFPPWPAVRQQAVRRVAAGVLEAVIHDPRLLPRDLAGRRRRPSAAVLDSRALRATPESGRRAGHDGAKRARGSEPHAAVDTLGHLLAPHVTPADARDRARVARLAAAVQDAAGEAVEPACADQGYAGERPTRDAAAPGVRLVVVERPEAERGFVLLPERRVVERPLARAARRRRLARDHERPPRTLAGPRFLAFACLVVARAAPLLARST